MAIKVVYENKAVGVTGNVTNTASDMQDFVDLTQLDDPNVVIKNYGTLEGNNWLLKDDVLILPDDLTSVGMGLWSTQMSNDDGSFDTPIVVTRTYNNTFTAPGVTLTFDTYNNTFADRVNVKWYRDSTLLYDNDYEPNSSVYFCEQNVVAYNKIVITLTHMNKASRFLKLWKIDDGIIREFYKDEILGLTISEGISDTGESLSINTMNLNLLSKSSVKIIFQRVQALKVYNDNELYGTFFVESSERTLNNYNLLTYDLVGMLDNNNFYGGIYNNYSAATLVSEICADLPYELDESFNSVLITGYLPIMTAREALMQVAFVLNAIVDTSRSDKIKIYPIPAYNALNLVEIDSDRAGNDSSELTEAPVTKIELTAHKYVVSVGDDGINTEEIYNDILNGPITSTFSNAHFNYSITGGTIISSSANHVTFTGTGGTVVVTSNYYDDKPTVYSSYNPLNTANSIPNVKQINNAYLVNASNVSSVMDRLEDAIYNTNTLDVSFILEDEKVGDYVQIETIEGTKTGQLININYDLSGNTIYANCTIREAYDGN